MSGHLSCTSMLRVNKDAAYSCSLPVGHDGSHKGGGMWWSGPGNGPDPLASTPDRQPSDAAVEAAAQAIRDKLAAAERSAARKQEVIEGLQKQMREFEADLRELVEYFESRTEFKGRDNEIGADTAYDDAATRLQKILDGEA